MGKLDKGAAFGAALSLLAVEPAFADQTKPLTEDQRPSIQLAGYTSGQIENCGLFVKEQRELAEANGVDMTRTDVRSLLVDCRGGKLQERIAEQEQILAALDVEIRQLDLRLDEQAQILDEQNRVLARIVAINGKLIIRKQELTEQRLALQEDTSRKLRQADEILQRLATS